MMRQEKKERTEAEIIADTKQVLLLYRPVKWILHKNKVILETDFEVEYGTEVDDFLEKIYEAGMDINTDLKDFKVRIRNLNESNLYMKLVEEAVETLKCCDDACADIYYEIIRRAYLEEKQFGGRETIIRQMREAGYAVSYATFYRYQKKALLLLGEILWGCHDLRVKLETVKREVVPDDVLAQVKV